jgi:hypothetical protein
MKILRALALLTAMALLGARAGPSNPEMMKAWTCTAKDDPGSVPGGPHEYSWRGTTKEEASAGALAQCKSRSGYPATCLVDSAYCQPVQ